MSVGGNLNNNKSRSLRDNHKWSQHPIFASFTVHINCHPGFGKIDNYRPCFINPGSLVCETPEASK